MKKKIKDLTLEEMVKICKKDGGECINCPLTSICVHIYDGDFSHLEYAKVELNKEIEVEEDKPQKCKDLRGCC